MRRLAVPYAVLAAVLALDAAVAQTNPGQSSSPSAETTGQAVKDAEQAVWPAPNGHRQPGAKDVPPKVEENLGIRSAEDVQRGGD